MVLIQGAIKGEAYGQLLQEQIPGLLERMNQRSAYLLQDHATSHEKGIKNVKSQLNIKTFDSYPSNSPDLNPIGRIWVYWKTRIQEQDPQGEL